MSENQDISSTTQKFLDIFDITSDATVLRDGTVSIILVVSAMNFGLLAEAEQDSIIYSYASLLNSLNFPIQIVINSKTKDATAYLQLLENQISRESSEAKKAMIKRYQNFVAQLIKERNVLDKKFYVIIPAQPIEVGMLTAQSVLPGKQVPEITQEQKTAVIEKGLGILEPRRDHLIAQFNKIGLYARQLVTQEIIEIFYNNYNPEASEGQQITDSKNYTTAMVNAGTTKAPSLTEIRQQIDVKTQLEKLSGQEKESILDKETEPIGELPQLDKSTDLPINQPVQPVGQVNQPINQPTQPTEQVTQSVGQPAQSIDQSTQPTDQTIQPIQPIEQANQPSIQPIKNDEAPLPPVAEL
ncbi:MAG: hypothetical protein A2383_00390 [Candidatus Pacebacteria bacterium RIFOXYB1_FULL_39_46]|nr:MAG: hypothetical protein A2182_00220 [Candidatus Pacebacteria bacterium RIFOXYA1_FULL_38_18]OGJ38046.1 MAG: hypothetical protein A2383_00390 [Candidatus Pacebacteria bacterium RIFOXYB1_FULL_39_46]OGJ39731.1 MAG: hypothetical protein A2411_03055 [Candidatus Pacebacteria bacterium RIFOXYC1_FULL_39_21]OGJ39798.1 MAG: hypothetical protein A2582_00155 [Candidatus Pacebacteria bacterium RIFOXYD1_FULL_39_27]